MTNTNSQAMTTVRDSSDVPLYLNTMEIYLLTASLFPADYVNTELELEIFRNSLVLQQSIEV
jgi:hypothetical protein